MLPFIEKYRPKDFHELVTTSDISSIKDLISKPLEMPNLLFYGPQGTGKTTMVKIIVDKLSPIDVLRINGSDTTGVDTIRDRVYNYMISMSSVSDKPKLIWIEEFDFMSANAYAALRAMMEQHMKNARFIVTCNYINKIPEPIVSRFAVFEFTKPKDFQEAEVRLKAICDAEGIEYDRNSNVFIDLLNKYSGDLRSCINYLQKETKDKILKDIDLDRDVTKLVYELILEKQWSKIRYDVPRENLDYNTLLVRLDDLFFNSEIEVTKKAEINEIIAEGQFQMYFSFDKNICFAAIASKIIKALGETK